MVEGHQCHRVAHAHRRLLLGRKFEATSPNGRFVEGAAAVNQKPLEQIEVHGKNLFYFFGTGPDAVVVHIHFGMSGAFRTSTLPGPTPTETTRLRLVNHQMGLVAQLSAMTVQHGSLELYQDKCSKLGPDPLREDADKELLWGKMQKLKKPVGLVLMDQACVAGIGNIYRAEILFKAGVHPELPCNTVKRDAFELIWYHSVTLLQRGFRCGSILTVDPQEGARLGKPWTRRYIYNQKTCGRCKGPIRTWDMATRTVYACPTCQPLRDASQLTPGRRAAMGAATGAQQFKSHCAPDDPEDLVPSQLSVAQLKALLRSLNLNTEGKKAVLIARLEAAMAWANKQGPEHADEPPASIPEDTQPHTSWRQRWRQTKLGARQPSHPPPGTASAASTPTPITPPTPNMPNTTTNSSHAMAGASASGSAPATPAGTPPPTLPGLAPRQTLPGSTDTHMAAVCLAAAGGEPVKEEPPALCEALLAAKSSSHAAGLAAATPSGNADPNRRAAGAGGGAGGGARGGGEGEAPRSWPALAAEDGEQDSDCGLLGIPKNLVNQLMQPGGTVAMFDLTQATQSDAESPALPAGSPASTPAPPHGLRAATGRQARTARRTQSQAQGEKPAGKTAKRGESRAAGSSQGEQRHAGERSRVTGERKRARRWEPAESPAAPEEPAGMLVLPVETAENADAQLKAVEDVTPVLDITPVVPDVTPGTQGLGHIATAQEAALEKLLAGESRAVEHVALHDTETDALLARLSQSPQHGEGPSQEPALSGGNTAAGAMADGSLKDKADCGAVVDGSGCSGALHELEQGQHTQQPGDAPIKAATKRNTRKAARASSGGDKPPAVSQRTEMQRRAKRQRVQQ